MAVAFKEWYVVCEALGRGQQNVLIRKGGIHEGRDGFSFKHSSFYLFPTLFHKQSGMVKPEARQWMPEGDRRAWDEGESVPIRYRCEVEKSVVLTRWQDVLELDARHVYTEELLRERFDWEGKGMDSGSISVAYVQTHVVEPVMEITYGKAHGGCRSWLDI